ncbi:MAG: S-formylglutathione hydrolase [Pseudomonadota bacterium]
MQLVSENRSHGGTQYVVRHASAATQTDMVYSIFVPDHAPGTKLPVLWYLSGLTCTHANVTEKGEYRRACAEHGIIFVAPDTSPRGDGVPDDPDQAYDFGLGAGFYVDATQAPFAEHYQMRHYIESELPAHVAEHFPIDMARQSMTGHSMGGHGALTIALRNPGRFQSVSAFAPIVSPINCPWGQKALRGYLGEDPSAWRAYDACALMEDGARLPALKIDQGAGDNFLESQLKPELLQALCEQVGQPLSLTVREGYDHSYFFISSFMAEHIAWHAEYLKQDD